MARRVSYRRVKGHHTKTISEWADELGIHKNTLMRWIRHGGLGVLRDRKPWLVRGVDLRAFLQKRQIKAKLPIGEMHCFRCRTGRKPAGGMLEYNPTSGTAGMLRALCPVCEVIMCQAIREADISRKFPGCEATFTRPQDTLSGSTDRQPNGVILDTGLKAPGTHPEITPAKD